MLYNKVVYTIQYNLLFNILYHTSVGRPGTRASGATAASGITVARPGNDCDCVQAPVRPVACCIAGVVTRICTKRLVLEAVGPIRTEAEGPGRVAEAAGPRWAAQAAGPVRVAEAAVPRHWQGRVGRRRGGAGTGGWMTSGPEHQVSRQRSGRLPWWRFQGLDGFRF